MTNRAERTNGRLAQIAHGVARTGAEHRNRTDGAELAERIHGLFAHLPEAVAGGIHQRLQRGLIIQLADADCRFYPHLPVVVVQQADQRRADTVRVRINQRAGGSATHIRVFVLLRTFDQCRQVLALFQPAQCAHCFTPHLWLGVLQTLQRRCLGAGVTQRLERA